jgi:exopolyphosphatase/guanosine-5'-triphosphate,3'-diphosphate pyrophosphatase
MSAPDDKTPRDVAVIDIGSNSVRLVVYRLEGRAIWTVYNEKVLAGLGSELSQTGRLSTGGVENALRALRRFSAVLDAAKPSGLFVAATAAVREAEDGKLFVSRVLAETGLAVRVLSGEDEARYAALGVLGGAPAASGLVGDLGGASLELTRVGDGDVGAGVSLPLGPFNLRGPGGFDPARVRARASEVVDAVDAARFIARQSKGSLDRIEGLSKRRMETLPYAAVVLEVLIERLGLKRIVLSAYGLREGLLLEAMPAALRAQDPLIAGCEALGLRQGVSETIGPALEDWVWPLFSRLAPMFGDRDRNLVAAACRLADLGARLHPDHRADLVFEQVLRAPIAGWDHAERTFIAAAMFARHTASTQPPEPQTLARLLSPERTTRARALGAAMRLGCDLSGRSADLLRRSALNIDGDVISLTADGRWSDMLLGEQTAKRAATLADLLEVGLRMGG